MRRRDLCLDIFTENQAAISRYSEAEHSGDPERRRVLAALSRAAKGELTGRQMQCVELCYFQMLTGRQAAQELGINESTVSRHLKKARRRLKTVLGYSFPRFENGS